MNMKMRTMMKNDKMFNADSNMNAILVHSLHKNVSNNRSMNNTFLTIMSKVTNAISRNSIAQSISKPMKHSNLFLKTLGVLSFILITATNVWSQCNITFPANSGAVPAQGSTIYFTDCDGNGSEVVSWVAPTATTVGTCGAPSISQGGGPSSGSAVSPGNYVVNYTAQAVNISNFSIVNVSYSFNLVVQSANPTAGGLTNAQTICAGTDPLTIASAVDGTQGSGNGTASSITYQWQYSLDNATWIDIAGATASTYDPSILSATTYYRRRTVVNFSNTPCSNGIVSGYTPSITITVIQNPSAGLINASQILCTTLDPSPFSNATSGTGTGAPLSYQWYASSQANSGYSAISGASNSTYDSPSLSATTFFQRKTILTLTSGELCYSAASNTIMVGDTTDPVLTCPSNQIVAANNNLCAYVVSGTSLNPTVTDDCSVTLSCALTGATVATNVSTLNTQAFNLGLTTVTWTATDAQGNSSTCSYTVTVQKPVVANQTATVCSGIVTGLTLGTSSSASPVVTYNINSITTTLVASAGSPATGTGLTNSVIADDAFTNSGNSQSTVVYNITPVSASGCEGSPFTATITVNPTPALSSSLSPAAICSGTTFAYTATSTTVAASGSTAMSWSRATVAGITQAGTTGSGNVSETLTNTTNAPINVTYVYTITSNGCSATNNVVVTVKPTPTVDAVSAQTLCAAATSSAISFASTFNVTGTTYAWSNSNTSIGLGASGTTSVPTFTATNTTNSAISGTITVTPTANGCSGSTQTATITVNPTPSLSSTLSPAAICSASTFAYTATSATVASSGSTVMTWSRATIAGITQAGTTGTGNISETLTNTTNAPIVVTYVYTIASNGCNATNNVVVTVNPTPTVNALSAQTLCAAATTSAITFASTFNVTGTTYAWSNSNTSIGLAASGTTSVPAFTATNTTNSAISGTITVTPTANGCSGSTQTATITVNPTPSLSSTLSPAAICSGSTFTYTATSATVASSGSTVMTWSRATVAGITESGTTGTGNISETFTNTTNAPINVTYVYTITSNGCSAVNNVVLTVSPLPVANAGVDQVVCNGANVTLAASGSNTYTWNNSVTNNVAFVASNSTNAPATTTYTLTVTNPSGCVSTDQVDVTVNPTPTVNTVANQTLCASTATTAVNFASTFNVTGTSYAWTNSSTAIGLAASGTGNISSFTATNTTTSPIVATITVTPSANSCAGTAKTFTITVQPIPVANQQSNITYCGGNLQSGITFTGTSANTQYVWTSSQHVGFFSGGTSLASASPSIGGYVIDPVNQVVSTVSVTPEIVSGGLTCSGSPMIFTVTVKPTPSVNANVNQTVCNGSSTAAITFTGSQVGSTYAWSNNNTTTGLAASGTGNIAAFTATNTGSSVQTSTISVTPTLNGCSGTPRTISLNVNPTPTVTQPANQTVCAGTNFAATNFTGAVTGTTYSWSSSNTAVGLAASGTGNIAAFAATNTTNAPISTTVTVTPSFGETGTTFGETSENGTIILNAPTGTVFTSVNYASYGNPTGSNGNYTNGSCHSNTSQAVVEALVIGQTSVTINATDAAFGSPCAGTQSLAVVLAYGPVCSGVAKTFTLTVNPVPSVTNQTATICSEGTFTVAPINGNGNVIPLGTTYSWSAPTVTGITGTAVGTNASSISGTLTNTTNADINVVYTVTPTSATTPTCAGTSFSVTVTVAPKATVTAQTQTICSGSTFTVTPTNGSGNIVPAGTTYSWSAPTVTGITGTTSGSNSASISGNLINTTNAAITVTYSVTPTSGSCAGTPFSVSILVNPVASFVAQTASICSGGTLTITPTNGSGNIVPTGTTYSWSFVNNANVTGEAIGTNQSNIVQTLSNSTNIDQPVVYTVTPTSGSCTGSSYSLTITVNPIPVIANKTQTICSGNAFTIAPTNGGSEIVPAGTQYIWTVVNNTNVSGDVNEATAQNTISQTLTNSTNVPQTVVYTVTPVLTGCNGNPFTVTVTVNPVPVIVNYALNGCSGTTITSTPINGSGNLIPAGTTYTWSFVDNSFVLGEQVANSGQTTFSQSLVNLYTTAQLVNYTVTPSSLSCAGNTFTIAVTVNELPTVAAITGATNVCTGLTTQLASATVGGTWSSSNTAVATVNASGVVTGVTAGSAVMTYTFTNANGCSSSTTTNFTVNPLPTATITTSGSTTFCQGGSVTLTANTASSYQWSNGATTASITVNASGNYTVTITNANGCSAVSVPTTVTVNALPTATITANGPTTFCQGGNVTLVASSGASYLWSNGAPTQSISVTTAGTYSVTVTSAAGCTATSSSTIVTVNALPVATINPIGSTTFCQGSLVTLIASTGTSYLWSSGETTQGIIANVDGPYTVTVTNANGCSATSANTNVVVNPLPTVAAITGLNDVCVGSTTVLATTSIGGVWSSNNSAVATISPSGVVTGITAGNAVLSYSITNVNGCTNSATAAMTVNAGTTATIAASGTTTFCAGGSVTLTASAGSSYEWSTGSLNPSITVSTTGSYYVNVTNALGCTATSVLTQVVVNPLPVVSAITGSTDVCIGNSTQLANATIGGVWSSSNNNIATVDANGLVTSVTAGSTNISYTVTSSNGCTTSVSEVVTVNALPTVSIAANSATTFCAGGSVTLVATAGTNYLWNNGQITQSITVDTAGTYFTTVTNAAGCSAISNAITVTVNALPIAVVTANGSTTFCQGNNVLLTATGGTSYVWSTGETTQSILVSTSENIHVDVTNSNGCTSAAANTIVTVLPVTVATITANGPTAICLGSNVTLSATAGTGLTYLWSNGVTTSTTQNITVSNAGTYSVTVTNASGCTSTVTQTVTVNANPAVTVTANGPTLFCQGGSVTLTATGAASYEWNTGDFTSSITVSSAGSYFVVGTSAAGCVTTSATTIVTTSTIPTVAAITGANNVCEGGTINLTSSTINGTWTSTNNFIATVSNSGIVTGLNAGTTTITYTVSNGACSNAATAVVNVLNNPVVPIITPSGATTMCPGGTVILFASNGANYQWSNGPLTPFITVNQSGDYAVTVTNASGCSATSLPINVFIGDNTNPVIIPPANITMAPNFGCDAIGVNLGNPTATDNCSVATVSHNAPAIFPLGLTTVTWTVVDGSGNTSTATQFVNVVDNILPTINVNDITVVINDNGSTTITFSDVDNGTNDNCGIASMTLSQYTFGCSNIGDNNITVTVTDNNGNVATTTILVTVVTSGTDTDNDGTLNACDTDDDGDGINDVDEVVGDTDGDGIQNSLDSDDDGDGISTSVEGTDDIDGDGISNYLDSDSDGDGISDDFEWDFGGLAEAGQDCDNDGVYDFLDTDLCGPVIPEAFTPNGNGFNDNFVIPGIEGYETRSVSVYSRYGTLVYESSMYNNDWNGTLLNSGTQVPDGTYYYIFTFDNGLVVNGYVYINRVQK